MSTIILPEKCSNVKCLDYLRDYLKAGFNVIPLKVRDKIPAVKKWKPLLNEPLTEESLLELYQSNPELNIGLITGPSSRGLVVIDIDHSPPEELAFLIAQNPTATVKTSRGRHYYYLSETKLSNLNFDWGELRADGVYVVAPPSIHPDGTLYEFLGDCQLDEIAKLPDTVQAFLVSDSKSKKSGNEGVVSIEHSILATYESNSILTTLPETYKSLDIAIKIVAFCGQKVSKLGQSFYCPLHDDKRPSVSLWRGKNGSIMLHEFHRGNKFITLVEMYASYVTGKDIQLKKGEMVIWWLRALEDIGVIKPKAIKARKLKKDAPESVKKLYEGFIRLIKLRKVYDPKQDTAPYSWSFAQTWCGIGSFTTVSKGMKYLLSNHYLEMVEKGSKIGEGSKAALFKLK